MAKTKCYGWRRTGGAFTLGLPTWKQCDRKPVVDLTVKQGKEERITLPSCLVCWEECMINPDIKVIKAEPISQGEQK